MLIKKFKAFLNKDSFDYSEGLVDPFEYHSTFYKMLVAFKVAEVDDKAKWLNQNALIFVTGLLASILSIISMWHGIMIFDLPLITEGGTYALVLCYELLILSCTKRNLPQFQNLLEAMKEDFHYICTVGNKYREKYFENQLLTWKICIFTCVFTASLSLVMVSVASLALIYFLFTQTSDDEGSRPLLFPFWLPNVDFGKSPVYELAFVFANVCALLYTYNYNFMIQTQVVWIRHLSSKVDIIIWSIEELLIDVYPATNKEEEEYYSEIIVTRMKKIVVHHQAMLSVMEDYSNVYKKLLMYEQQCCSPVVCLTAYCAAQKIDEGEVQPILLVIFCGTIVLYFIPNYLCTFLAIKVSSICDACWNIPFWTATPAIRPYMVLIMQRALRPLPLYAAGFESISLQTFSKKMTSAYSYFNMLRQVNI